MRKEKVILGGDAHICIPGQVKAVGLNFADIFAIQVRVRRVFMNASPQGA